MTAPKRGAFGEPWSEDDADPDTIRRADKLAIAGMCINGRGKYARRIDSARIVAAVNALDGMEPSALALVIEAAEDAITELRSWDTDLHPDIATPGRVRAEQLEHALNALRGDGGGE